MCSFVPVLIPCMSLRSQQNTQQNIPTDLTHTDKI